MKNIENKKSKGTMRMIFFREDELIHGVCLDFDILVNGSDFEEVKTKLLNISKDYLKTIIDNNLDDALLNRHAPKEYWDMYENTNKLERPIRQTSKPISTYMQFYPMLVPA